MRKTSHADVTAEAEQAPPQPLLDLVPADLRGDYLDLWHRPDVVESLDAVDTTSDSEAAEAAHALTGSSYGDRGPRGVVNAPGDLARLSPVTGRQWLRHKAALRRGRVRAASRAKDAARAAQVAASMCPCGEAVGLDWTAEAGRVLGRHMTGLCPTCAPIGLLAAAEAAAKDKPTGSRKSRGDLVRAWRTTHP